MVERSEIDQMAKFMAVMNYTAPDTGTGTSRVSVPPNPAIAEMKTILERFHAAADQVVMEARHDRDLREALMMEPTVTGARMGSWEIRVKGDRRKLYDVVNVLNGEALAVDLMLYEAAHGLVRMLNDGGRINSPAVIEMLRAEQEYGGLVHDMVLYKHRLTHDTKSQRTPVFEARYTDARRRAVLARDRVCRLADHRA